MGVGVEGGVVFIIPVVAVTADVEPVVIGASDDECIGPAQFRGVIVAVASLGVDY